MAKQNRTKLKGYFETGDIPNQNQYADLIDSNLNLSESNTGDITLIGKIDLTGNITASGNISASGLLYVNEIQDIATINHDNNAFGNLDFTSAGTLRLRSTNSTSYGLKFFGGAQFMAAPYIDTDSHINFLLKVNGTERISINSSGLTLTGNITSSANISASGTITANAFVGPITGTVTGTSTGLTGTPSILVANITSSGNISASGGITANAFYGDGSGLTNAPSTFTNITASGNISASGAIIGSTLAIDSITSTAAELNLLGGVSGLVQADFTKLAAINTSAAELNYLDGISSAQGGYVKAMNQSVASTSAPTFAGLTLTKKDYGTFDLDSAQSYALGGDPAGQLLVGQIPEIVAGASSATYTLTTDRILATSVIMISTSALITCNATNIIEGSCKITFHNPTQTSFSGGNVTINIVIL
jgi:hypothetical protein